MQLIYFLYLVYQAYLADVNNMILYYKYPKLELSNFANLNCICEKFGHAFIKSFGGPNSLYTWALNQYNESIAKLGSIHKIGSFMGVLLKVGILFVKSLYFYKYASRSHDKSHASLFVKVPETWFWA